MPLPDEVPTFTLTAAFPPLAEDGVERTGTLTFTPVPNLLADADYLFTGVENATLDATGGMSKTLVACDALDEPFVWRVDGRIDGMTPWSVNISVPASAGTVQLGATAEFEALPPDYYVVPGPQGPEGPPGSGGGTGTPSSTVVSGTSFGVSSAAGTATAYSRGDHSHGTPATPTKATVGLGNVDNTSDASKPLSSAATTALAAKADLVGGVVPTTQVPTASALGGLAKASNLSDVSSASAARTNLGLGTAATQASTAFDAAGAASTVQSNLTSHAGSTTSVHGIADTSALVTTTDPRLSDNRTPSGTAGGDLSGSYPNPGVAKVAGVAVSGTAASGKVLTATSSSAASWQTPTGGGGGGASIVSQGDDRVDLEIVVLTNSASWTVVRTSGGVAIGKSVKAAAGDRVLVSPSFMYSGTQYELDLAVMASDGTSISRYAGSSGSGTTPGAEGYAPFYTQATSFPHASGLLMFTVAAGEVDGSGLFTVNLAYHAPSLSGTDQHIYAGAGYLARWVMLNIGPEPA